MATAPGSGGGGGSRGRQPLHNGGNPPPSDFHVEPSEKRIQQMFKSAGVYDKHVACLRCAGIHNKKHRQNWQRCTSLCPICPPDNQHWGLPCSRLVHLYDNTWWNVRTGRSKNIMRRMCNSNGTFDAKSDLDRLPDDRKGRNSQDGRDRSLSPSGKLGRTYRDRSPYPLRSRVHQELPEKRLADSIPRPTSVSDHSIHERIVQDPFMRMIIQQNVLFADFFDRHPDVTNGRQVISNGMRHYLREMRVHNPDYLSPNHAHAQWGGEEGGPSSSPTSGQTSV